MFDFGNQFSSDNKKAIRFRISQEGISYYLFQAEGLFSKYEQNSIRDSFYEGDGKRLTIRPYYFSLGFNFTASSDKIVTLDKIIDFEKLNEFILTGKQNSGVKR